MRGRRVQPQWRSVVGQLNLLRTLHASLRMTPEMAAGATDKLWEVADIVVLIEA